MVLTPEQKEYLSPMMIEYEKNWIPHQTINFEHFGRVVEVFKQNNEPIKPCMSCGSDKVNYIKYMYNLWKQ